ncbi:MAG: hypothetical protein JWN04_5925 [Myxococcaceae bacterium]|nr:hypothetical protein [Myxococcaceae bacterium]
MHSKTSDLAGVADPAYFCRLSAATYGVCGASTPSDCGLGELTDEIVLGDDPDPVAQARTLVFSPMLMLVIAPPSPTLHESRQHAAPSSASSAARHALCKASSIPPDT